LKVESATQRINPVVDLKIVNRRNIVGDQPNDSKQTSPQKRKSLAYNRDSALAFEMPFTIVGAVILGGLLGYFLDRWLHTKLIFTLVLGGLGFAGGLKEVLRRLSQIDK
jgi:F0F1-type ATP synthase assembly protein I